MFKQSTQDFSTVNTLKDLEQGTVMSSIKIFYMTTNFFVVKCDVLFFIITKVAKKMNAEKFGLCDHFMQTITFQFYVSNV